MFAVESYAAVRRFVFVEGHSRREAARVFGLIPRRAVTSGRSRTSPAANWRPLCALALRATGKGRRRARSDSGA